MKLEIMTDRPTDQPTGKTSRPGIGKIHFQVNKGGKGEIKIARMAEAMYVYYVHSL